ncbi:MAG: hypothetical protein JW798_10510 [Prolixibacteraceae bacterium]|nr:hypothetical protein [Prolixibacteraceae bacterium]
MKRFYTFSLLLVITFNAFAQLRPGEWEYHLSMQNTLGVAVAGQKTYFLSQGGIFYYNQQDGSIETMTKIDRLSGPDFHGISYNPSTQSIVVTYKNSCIDIIRSDGSVFPILDIKRKTISGDKMIYNATHLGNLCYLACGFGIVVLDLQKLEIKDSYFIGENGNVMQVFDIAFDNDTLWAATREGIKFASLNAPNLLDYSYWYSLEDEIMQPVNYNYLKSCGGRLWAVHIGEEWWDDKTYTRFGPNNWKRLYGDIGIINSFNAYIDKIIYCSSRNVGGTIKHRVEIFNMWNNDYLLIDQYPFEEKNIPMYPQFATIDDNGNVWIADKNYGGIMYANGQFTRIMPQGPDNNNMFSVSYSGGALFVADGGYGTSWNNLYNEFGIKIFNENQWEIINKKTHEALTGIKDVVEVLPVEGNPIHFYAATWGYGIMEFKDGELFTIHNESNSNLKFIPGYGQGYMRIGGMDFDSEGNLWVTNSEVEYVLHKRKASDGKWQPFYLPEITLEYKIGDVMVDSNDNIWIIIPRDRTYGLYVMSNDGIQKKHLDVTSFFSNGEDELKTPMNDVYCIAEDNDGEIWVGTSKGVAVYSNPYQVFDQKTFYASQPGLDLNDGIYHPLLSTNTVTAIAVDGGNRKWCGTKSSGLYLISANGEQEIEHFTIDNSSLISNTIISLAYDGDHGLLYIATPDGLVAYRTDSKNPENAFENVYAYPNPVREGYEGNIYITGLMNDTNVKITTVSGRLVYETTSFGGQAVWDGKDLAGNKVHTGVYLAMCASKDGEQSAIAKILFIR